MAQQCWPACWSTRRGNLIAARLPHPHATIVLRRRHSRLAVLPLAIMDNQTGQHMPAAIPAIRSGTCKVP